MLCNSVVKECELKEEKILRMQHPVVNRLLIQTLFNRLILKEVNFLCIAPVCVVVVQKFHPVNMISDMRTKSQE